MHNPPGMGTLVSDEDIHRDRQYSRSFGSPRRCRLGRLRHCCPSPIRSHGSLRYCSSIMISSLKGYKSLLAWTACSLVVSILPRQSQHVRCGGELVAAKALLFLMSSLWGIQWICPRTNIIARDSIYICYSAYYAIARPSVRLSVRLSHGWISQKQLKLGSCNFHHRVAP